MGCVKYSLPYWAKTSIVMQSQIYSNNSVSTKELYMLLAFGDERILVDCLGEMHFAAWKIL